MGSRSHNQGMKKAERDVKAPRGEDGNSWADETLPLGVRKELLACDLKKVTATKSRPQSAASQPGLTGRKADGRTPERAR
jgi:hypothetical protein